MQLALHLDMLTPSSNRIQILKKDTDPSLIKDCVIELDALSFAERLDWIKTALKSMKRTTKQEVKATFYFEEPTKVELPYGFKQLQFQWVTEMTLKLTWTQEGLWVSKLKNKKVGRSIYDFPLDQVTELRLEAIERPQKAQLSLINLWKRKHAQVWQGLMLDEVSQYLDEIECLDLTAYFSQDDLEYALGCFEWEDEFELQAQTKFQRIRLRAERGKDEVYRTWATLVDTRQQRLKRYLWLNPTEALFYREERYER